MTSERMIQVPESTLRLWADRLKEGGTHGWEDRMATVMHDMLATQPAAGVPIGKIVSFGPKLHEVAWHKGKLPPLGTELYTAPPAAAHGDEAVRISKLLELADQHAERRLADARSDEEAAAELESSEENEAGNWYGACIAAADTARASAAIIKSLTDEIRSSAAMRAQGDGEVQ